MTPKVGMYEELRSRPRGRSRPDYANFFSMVLIASKYDLDPKGLADAFLEAWGIRKLTMEV